MSDADGAPCRRRQRAHAGSDDDSRSERSRSAQSSPDRSSYEERGGRSDSDDDSDRRRYGRDSDSDDALHFQVPPLAVMAAAGLLSALFLLTMQNCGLSFTLQSLHMVWLSPSPSKRLTTLNLASVK